MFRVYACITQEHDLRLVLLAGLVCLSAAYTALRLLGHASEATSRRGRLAWMSTSAAVAGGGIWSTHFVAMLAFRPGFPVGYDIGLTALSAIIGTGITWIGFAAALAGGVRSVFVPLGGTIMGAAIGAMHYAGIVALHVPGQTRYDPGFVAASMVVGMGGGAAALFVALRGRGPGHRIAAAL